MMNSWEFWEYNLFQKYSKISMKKLVFFITVNQGVSFDSLEVCLHFCYMSDWSQVWVDDAQLYNAVDIF